MTDTTEARSGPNVHNGTYTVSHPEHGHFTAKLYTAQKGALQGKRILAILIGPNNQADFKPVAFWDDDKQRANVWKRYRSPVIKRDMIFDGVCWQESWNATEKKIAIWCDMVKRGSQDPPAGYWHAQGYKVQLEGRCVVCNRPLTDPTSIETGIGPICASR